MGSILEKIDDDYDDYELYCKSLGVQSMRIGEDFYQHWKELRIKEQEIINARKRRKPK